MLFRRRTKHAKWLEELELRTLFSSPGFHASINFQPANVPVPAGYLVDSGAVYGARGNGLSYGWNADDSANTRDRDSKLSADQRYDTFIHMQKPGPVMVWQLAVPNGSYTVHIVSGDATATDSNYRINVENTLVVNGKPSSSKLWVEGTKTISVTDGFLTVSNASGSVNNKIDFIDVNSVGSTTTPPVTPPPPPILPDPTVDTIEMSTPDASASELNLDPGTIRFTRSGPIDQDLTVNYYVAGTATPGVDYQALPGSIVIPSGQTTADVTVTPINDSTLEPAESVLVEIQAGDYDIGNSKSATVTLVNDETSATEQPYYGTPVTLSATIQAEDFDQGPEGTAYRDQTPGNASGSQIYRFSDMDIAPTTDVGGGFAVTHLQKDEFLKYTVDVPVTGTYRIETRVASTTAGSTFHISFDGVTTGTQTFPNTGGVDKWTTLVKTATLTAGVHAMKFYVDTAKASEVGSLNYIRVYQDLSATTKGATLKATANLPTSRQESGSATLGSFFYDFGGLNNGVASTRVDRFDPTTNLWTRMADMPEAITEAAVVAVGSQAWLIGGYLGNDPGTPTTHVWIYDSTTNTWSAGPGLPYARGAGDAALVGSVIHFFGGRDVTRDGDHTSHWGLDLNNLDAGWTTLAGLPSPRNAMSAAVINGQLYAIGGEQLEGASAIALSEVDVYDAGSDTWSRVADMPLALSHANQSTFVFDNKIIVVGGDLSHNQPSDTILSYDPAANTWSLIGHLPSARAAMAAGVVGNTLIATGGYSATGVSNLSWTATLKPSTTTYTSFTPGAVWNDTSGNPIQAHGGDMLYSNGVYYWYGENKNTKTYLVNGEPHADVIGISVYTSTDLYNWTYHGLALPGTSTGDLAPTNVLERPKVLYNASTGKYVMWMHVDTGDYAKASVGVAVADSPLGPFVYQGSFRPLGLESRDMTVFQDDDGTAYVVFATDHNRSIRIAEMTPDYLGLTGDVSQPYSTPDQREAPILVKQNGSYFLITSQATWFAPNAAMYAVASSPMGPYTIVGNPAYGAGASTTYNSQGAFVFQDVATGQYIFMADRWNTADLGSSRYVWLPLNFNGNTLSIDNPVSWVLSNS